MCEFYTEFDSDTPQIQLSMLVGSYHSFRQGDEGNTLHNVADLFFLKKKDLVSHTRGHVLGQDYSGTQAINTNFICAIRAL